MNAVKGIYFPELDGLRFFAFLLVFIHHHSFFSKIPYLSFLNTYGWAGVDLFLCLSAFLFTKLLVAEFNVTKKISLKKFYIRRIFRIWPLYFFFIAFSIAFSIFSNGFNWEQNGLRIIGLFTFSDNILTAMYGYNPLPFTEHLWTITYEEQFYIFIPLIILLLIRSSFKKKLFFLITIFIILNVIRYFFIANKLSHPSIWVLPITHFESIFFGIVVGFGGFDFLVKRIGSIVMALIGVLSFFLVCLLPNLDNNSYWLILSYSLVGISTSMILCSVFNNYFFKKIFSKKILVFLGKRSYGLYVYHLLGNWVASDIIPKLIGFSSSLFASFIYSLVFTIIASIISYRIIEMPFLKFKKKFEVIISRPI